MPELKLSLLLHAGAALGLQDAGSGDRGAISKNLTSEAAWAGEMQGINVAARRQGARAMNRLMNAAALLLLTSVGLTLDCLRQTSGPAHLVQPAGREYTRKL